MIPIKNTKDAITAALKAHILSDKKTLHGQILEDGETTIEFDGDNIKISDPYGETFTLFDIEVRLKKA